MSVSYWGVDHGEFISKRSVDDDGDYNPNKGFRGNGIAYSKPGARKRTSWKAFKYQNTGANLKTQGKHVGTGATAGAAVGALASRGNRKMGALLGGEIGAIGGAITGGHVAGVRATRQAVSEGLKSGDIKRRPKDQITAFGGTRRSK
jgi:hypothetical protein